MERLLRYWEQNKRKILITIAVIALVIILIQMANAIIKQQNAANANKEKQNTQVAQDITKPNQAVISDTKLNEQQTQDNSKIIEDFVNYCNQKNIVAAYNLLSESCKEEVYKTQELFEAGYVNQIFSHDINHSLELWYTNGNYTTYQITYNKGNLLQTGGQVSSSNFVDYITIDKQNNEVKLNINKFVCKETINKTGTEQGIEVAINTKSVYVDYEIYNMTVANNTQKTILLNNGRDINNICLIDRYDSIFSSVISEVPIGSLTIEPQARRTINMKFNKIYMTDRKIEEMAIKDIYLDKEQYEANQENIDRATIRINL